MAQPILTNDVFRFVHVRQPKPVRATDDVIDLTDLDTTGCDSELREILAKGDHQEAAKWAKAYQESDAFVTHLAQLPLPFADFALWFRENPAASPEEIKAKVVDLFGDEPATLIQTDAFQESCQRLSCSYLAITLLNREADRDRRLHQQQITALLDGLELCRLIKGMTQRGAEAKVSIVPKQRRTVLLPPTLATVLRARPAAAEKDDETKESPEDKRTALQSKITHLETVIDALTLTWRMDSDDRSSRPTPAPDAAPNSKQKSDQKDDDPFSRLIADIKPKQLKKLLADPQTRPLLLKSLPTTPPDEAIDEDLIEQLERNPDILSAQAINHLSPSIQATLDDANLDPATLPVPLLVDQLEKKLGQQQTQLLKLPVPQPLTFAMGSSMVTQLPPLDSIPGLSHLGKDWYGTLNVLGVGDLKVVRETLMRYEAGDVAHIENILQGELKERLHRRARLIEETFEEESETIETNERDLQTSERFELQSATSQQLQIEASAEGGASVSASYGPTVGVEANTAFSAGTSTELANSDATTFAREVINRSISRLQERTRTLYKRRTVNEFEETNRHGINNEEGDGHITGIYQFVNQVLCAQVYNYGKRLLLECFLPQPGRHLLEHAARMADQAAGSLERPAPFTLDPFELTAANVDSYVKQYRAASVDAPPERFRTVSHVLQFTVESGPFTLGMSHHSSDAKDVDIPSGYKAIRGYARFAYPALPYYDVTKEEVQGILPDFIKTATGDRWWPELVRCAVTMVVGRKRFKLKYREHVNDKSSNKYVLSKTFDLYDETVKLPIAATATHKTSLAVSVEIKCERTPEAYMQWQLDTHEKIMQGYLAMQSAYEERLAAAAIQQATLASGRNPLQNRQIEQDELKRQAVDLLWSQMIMVPAGQFPDLIQFTESAFEWENMSYQLFPYFWARSDQWDTLLQLKDIDPIHSQFLQAGATRVVLPVRNEFAARVLNFLSTASIWSAATTLTDPVHLDILEELKGEPDNPDGVPEGAPWEVKVPTPLIILKGGNDLPVFQETCQE